MKRNILPVAALLLAWSSCLAQTTEIQARIQQRQATIRYLLQRQAPEGGFTASANDKKRTLGATSSAIRALKYLGSEAPERDACAKFVASCFDKDSGGFRQKPGEGTPDVFATAVGLMAIVELKMPRKDYEEPAMAYLAKKAKSFEDIRIAAAGLEAIGKQPESADWLKMLAGMRNEDCSFGKGDDLARATGGAVACQLRLGEKLKDPKAILKVLKGGQRSDGGFGKEGAKSSDLETSYRVTRAFVMLGDSPAANKLTQFVERCRNDDGGYGVTPGAPSSVSGTYFAAILHHWLDKK